MMVGLVKRFKGQLYFFNVPMALIAIPWSFQRQTLSFSLEYDTKEKV